MIGIGLRLEATNGTLQTGGAEAEQLKARLQQLVERLSAEWERECAQINREVPLQFVATRY